MVSGWPRHIMCDWQTVLYRTSCWRPQYGSAFFYYLTGKKPAGADGTYTNLEPKFSWLNTTHGVMPYAQRLARFPAWVQQLEMESNGKQVSRDGTRLSQPASSLIWGEAGTNAQHSFFQYLHQADHVVPVDFLLPLAPVANDHLDQNQRNNHTSLVANALAQAELLATGKKDADDPHRQFPGNRPSSIISWPQTTPFTVGQLAALYENATISCGFIWGVNSFDQPGVELGKRLADDLNLGPTASVRPATALFQRHLEEKQLTHAEWRTNAPR